MKKYLIILTISVCSFSALAQSEQKNTKVFHFPSVQAYISPTFSGTTNPGSSQPYLGLSYGAHYTHWFYNIYSVYTGLKLSRVSTFSTREYPDTSIYRGPYKPPLYEPAKTTKTKHHIYFLSIPLNTKFFFDQRSPYYVFGGISLDFKFFTKNISKDYYDGSTEELEAIKQTDIEKPFSMGVNAAFGREFKNKKDFAFLLEAEFKLFSLYSSNKSTMLPYYAGINLGIEFYLPD